MNKKRIIFFLAFFSIFFLVGLYFLFFNIFQSTKIIEAGSLCQKHNVLGWAWSENIGWISFSCENETIIGEGVDYGVDINETGIFSGYAWSRGTTADEGGVGWITFDSTDLVGCPGPVGSCETKVDLNTGEVSGWARALAYGDGWDGWIKLAGDGGSWDGSQCVGTNDYQNTNRCNWGVKIDTSLGEFSGWAWSDMIIGWIKFEGDTYGVKTSFPFNQKPIASALPEEQNLCAWDSSPQVAAGLAITLKWTYFDGDGDTQTAYEIWLDDDSNFTGAKFNYKVEPSASTAYNLNLTNDLEGDWLSSLNWNTNYYWKVKVKDEGAWSHWSDVAQLITPLHASPYINFSWKPAKPTVDELVQFTDKSEVYGGATKSSRYWTFQDGSPSNSIEQNPTISFTSTGPKTVTLKVTDSDGYNCSDSRTLQVTLPLPEWEEISPF